jgi:TatA/E family protein of Tat protein translocase
MHTPLFVFEFLGTTELLVIALVALILFGPRKLPEIGRTVGKSIAEFKRASDDFKRTWEFEVELEQRKAAPDAKASAAETPPAGQIAGESGDGGVQPDAGGETVARTPAASEQEGVTGGPADESGWDVATGHAQATATGAPAGADENKAS